MIRRRYPQGPAGTLIRTPLQMTRSFNRRALGLCVPLAAAFGMTRVAAAQQPKEAPIKITEEKRGLFSKAKVSGDSAQKIALARVANGRITKASWSKKTGS